MIRGDLRRVGFWAATGHAADHHDARDPFGLLARCLTAVLEALPRVEEHVDPAWSEHERRAVLAHLARGREHAAYMGWSTCRLCGRDNGSREYTDGVYVWPEGLRHYIEAHAVRPPDEFVQHCKTRG